MSKLRQKLISHESPISMLETSKSYNDYDYILVHLLEQEEEYLNFFESKERGDRTSIMDTSIFELGESFDREKYKYWVDRIKPTEFILPDVLEECDKTLASSELFLDNYSNDYKGKTIGVVQGKNYDEICYCYNYLDKELDVDKLAFSFDYSYYQSLFPHNNKWVSFMMGRVILLQKMLQEDKINSKKPHHLLGCSNPLEFSFYKDEKYNFIESIDTSSPVVFGLLDKHYNMKIGDFEKPSIKLAELIKTIPTSSQLQAILKNVEIFKNIVNE